MRSTYRSGPPKLIFADGCSLVRTVPDGPAKGNWWTFLVKALAGCKNLIPLQIDQMRINANFYKTNLSLSQQVEPSTIIQASHDNSGLAQQQSSLGTLRYCVTQHTDRGTAPRVRVLVRLLSSSVNQKSSRSARVRALEISSSLIKDACAVDGCNQYTAMLQRLNSDDKSLKSLQLAAHQPDRRPQRHMCTAVKLPAGTTGEQRL